MDRFILITRHPLVEYVVILVNTKVLDCKDTDTTDMGVI